ncbi:Acetylcholinesterase 1, partial [Araneus ventricosus]
MRRSAEGFRNPLPNNNAKSMESSKRKFESYANKVKVFNEIRANFWCLLNFLFLICTLRVHGQRGDPRVYTNSGGVVGSVVHVNDMLSNRQIDVKQFLGIPYAEPPVGDLRFQKPQFHGAWDEDLECKDMPKACVQYMEAPYPWRMSPEDPNISEDCLYLNVWVPKDASPENKKSVFFWIYGGGFFMGSNRQEIYDGRVIAALGDV